MRGQGGGSPGEGWASCAGCYRIVQAGEEGRCGCGDRAGAAVGAKGRWWTCHTDICQVEAGGEVGELDSESDSFPLCSPLPHPRTPCGMGGHPSIPGGRVRVHSPSLVSCFRTTSSMYPFAAVSSLLPIQAASCLPWSICSPRLRSCSPSIHPPGST